MKKLTKNEAVRLHRKMRRWIADKTEEQGRQVWEEEYFKAMGIGENDIPFEECYCCEFDAQQLNNIGLYSSDCTFCPIDWDIGYKSGYEKTGCISVKYHLGDKKVVGYFKEWLFAKNPEKPEKEGSY